jgi:hypothetical protein
MDDYQSDKSFEKIQEEEIKKKLEEEIMKRQLEFPIKELEGLLDEVYKNVQETVNNQPNR